MSLDKVAKSIVNTSKIHEESIINHGIGDIIESKISSIDQSIIPRDIRIIEEKIDTINDEIIEDDIQIGKRIIN